MRSCLWLQMVRIIVAVYISIQRNGRNYYYNKCNKGEGQWVRRMRKTAINQRRFLPLRRRRRRVYGAVTLRRVARVYSRCAFVAGVTGPKNCSAGTVESAPPPPSGSNKMHEKKKKKDRNYRGCQILQRGVVVMCTKSLNGNDILHV